MSIEVTDILQPIRGCGERQENAFYLCTPDPVEGGCLPCFVKIETPIPVTRKPHRGPLVVDGDKILARWDEESWLAGSSADSLEKRKGDQWAIEKFGMTVMKRLDTGECKGLLLPEEALNRLAEKVSWSNRITDYIRNLTVANVAELPEAALPFSLLIRSFQEYVMSQRVSSLVEAVGRTWFLADKVQPRHREVVIPQLVAILTLMGLSRDAIDMRRRYAWEK